MICGHNELNAFCCICRWITKSLRWLNSDTMRITLKTLHYLLFKAYKRIDKSIDPSYLADRLRCRNTDRCIEFALCSKCPAEKKFDIICRFDYFSARNWQFFGIEWKRFENYVRIISVFFIFNSKENHCKLVASYDRCAFRGRCCCCCWFYSIRCGFYSLPSIYGYRVLCVCLVKLFKCINFHSST